MAGRHFVNECILCCWAKLNLFEESEIGTSYMDLQGQQSQIQSLQQWNYEINLLTTSIGWTATQNLDREFTFCNHYLLPNLVALLFTFSLLPGNIAQNIAINVFMLMTVRIHTLFWIHLQINVALLFNLQITERTESLNRSVKKK